MARLPRMVVALGAVSLLTDASSEMIYPLLPVFLAALGAGPAYIGLVEGVAETTASLLKWTGIFGAIGGLVGIGGFFGLDRLAHSASDARRRALGLGIGYGEQQAFGINFGRLVDPQAFMASVFQASHDISQRQFLYAAGLSSSDIRGRSTGQLSVELLQHLKTLADATPQAYLAQILQARGLEQFISLQDFERLKATSPREFASLTQSYLQNARTMQVSDQNLRKWQEFTTQLARATQKIESALLPALGPVADAFTKLSAAMANVISGFIKSGELNIWIKDAETSIEGFARFLGSKTFRDDLHQFGDDIRAAGQALHDLLKWLGYSTGSKDTSKGGYNPPSISTKSPLSFLQSLKARYNYNQRWTTTAHPDPTDVGNLRPPGSKTGFRHYGNLDDAYRDAAAQLVRDEYVHGLTTIRQIISDPKWGWAPASDRNDVKAYIGRLAKVTGINPDEKLNLRNNQQLATLLAGIVGVEKGHKGYPVATIVEVLNNTGGNATVTVSQAAH